MGLMSFLSRNHQHQSTDVSTSGLALSTTKLPTEGALLMPNTTNYYHLYEKNTRSVGQFEKVLYISQH